MCITSEDDPAIILRELCKQLFFTRNEESVVIELEDSVCFENTLEIFGSIVLKVPMDMSEDDFNSKIAKLNALSKIRVYD